VIELPGAVFLSLVKIDHPTRAICWDIHQRYLARHFRARVLALELVEKNDWMNGANGWRCDRGRLDVSYSAQAVDPVQEPVYHFTRHMNEMLDVALDMGGTIGVALNTDVVCPPAQIAAAVDLVRRGATFVIPFREVGWRYTSAWFRDHFRQDLDFGLLEKPVAYADREPSQSEGGAFACDLAAFRRKCGGENEDMRGWSANDRERAARVRKLGYLLERTDGYMYHLEHWRGGDSGAHDPGSPGEAAFREGNRVFDTICGMTGIQLEAWLAQRPWFVAATRPRY
jgi:hypothetical protein